MTDPLDEIEENLRNPLRRRFLEQEHRPIRALLALFEHFRAEDDGIRRAAVQGFIWSWIPFLLVGSAALGGSIAAVATIWQVVEMRKQSALIQRQDTGLLFADLYGGNNEQKLAAIQVLQSRGMNDFNGVSVTFDQPYFFLTGTVWRNCDLVFEGSGAGMEEGVVMAYSRITLRGQNWVPEESMFYRCTLVFDDDSGLKGSKIGDDLFDVTLWECHLALHASAIEKVDIEGNDIRDIRSTIKWGARDAPSDGAAESAMKLAYVRMRNCSSSGSRPLVMHDCIWNGAQVEGTFSIAVNGELVRQ